LHDAGRPSDGGYLQHDVDSHGWRAGCSAPLDYLQGPAGPVRRPEAWAAHPLRITGTC